MTSGFRHVVAIRPDREQRVMNQPPFEGLEHDRKKRRPRRMTVRPRSRRPASTVSGSRCSTISWLRRTVRRRSHPQPTGRSGVRRRRRSAPGRRPIGGLPGREAVLDTMDFAPGCQWQLKTARVGVAGRAVTTAAHRSAGCHFRFSRSFRDCAGRRRRCRFPCPCGDRPSTNRWSSSRPDVSRRRADGPRSGWVRWWRCSWLTRMCCPR